MPKRSPEQIIDGFCTMQESDLPASEWIGVQDRSYITPTGQYLKEGFHPVEHGDHLTVFDLRDPTKTIYSQTIDMESPLNPADRIHPFTFAKWFIDQNPAQLRKAVISQASQPKLS